MTLEEHYQRGLRFLSSAESLLRVDQGTSGTHAVIAHAHFGAASSGMAMEMFKAMHAHPQVADDPDSTKAAT